MYTEYSIYLSLFVQTSKIYTGCCPSDFLKLCSRRSGQVQVQYLRFYFVRRRLSGWVGSGS